LVTLAQNGITVNISYRTFTGWIVCGGIRQSSCAFNWRIFWILHNFWHDRSPILLRSFTFWVGR